MQATRFFILITVMAFSLLTVAEDYHGKVVSIADGDTITLLTPQNKQIKVRFHQIDTPEKAQPYGQKARQALADKIFNREIVVKVADTDRYGRIVGLVMLGQRNINYEMVVEGHAWAYRQYVTDASFISAENTAKSSKRGLWALQIDQITPPWEWRRLQKSKGRVATTIGAPGVNQTLRKGQFVCGAKSYCKDMSSCDEATFHLKQCGLSRLDRNKDGVPCEALCN